MKEPEKACPCGTGRPYARCCALLHGGALPVDAEQVMRSRYSAFVLQDERYLLATWHPSTRPGGISFNRDQAWLGLKVLDRTAVTPEAAEVEFVARTRVGASSIIRHHERSRFVRDGGVWFYVDGDLKYE